MSEYKFIDSDKLDAALEATASAIREKTGSSDEINFDFSGETGFATAVSAIPSGSTPSGTKQINVVVNGTITEDVSDYANAEIITNVPSKEFDAADFADGTKPSGDITFYTTYFGVNDNNSPNYYAYRSNITKLTGPNYNNTSNVTNLFRGMSKLKYGIFPVWTKMYNQAFYGDSQLLAVDFKGPTISGGSLQFGACTKMTTLIIRAASGTPSLGGNTAFQNSPFASGKAGGTLYVPQNMITKYQNATNWSTYLSYPNNTITSIEGSIYETQYADGSPCPTRYVNYSLTNCTSSTTITMLQLEDSYSTVISADSGYTLDSVTVVMNGVDVTSTVYDSQTNTITIASVNGRIVITATAS